ncbi:MAG: holo-[acyl-carrier-protein] synthase [Firmicutes bacterium HGW-Firmicutes-7]|nr:MAG: holo-[acyl-carrier-protein] synthase [Firmicutes bacterium HGW-Firmicutes-7]
MIKGIGNDIIEISRIKKAIERPRFMEKHYTINEIALYQSRNNNIEILAGNFAVKESVSKVFGTGVRGFSLKDIEVLRDELGKPYVLLFNEAKMIAEVAQIEQIFVSIAHSEKYVVGFAVGEGAM